MPAKIKHTQRNKAAKSQRRATLAAPRTNADLRAGEDAQVARREPVVAMTRAEAARSRSVDAIEKTIAKEDAKIIAKASARALRRACTSPEWGNSDRRREDDRKHRRTPVRRCRNGRGHE
jgi:hypothetical protein